MTTNTIHFPTGPNGTDVLRLSKNGVWANPDIPVEDAAKLVLNALDYNIKVLVQKAVEEEREACSKLCKELAPSNKTMTAYKVLHEASKAIQSRGQE